MQKKLEKLLKLVNIIPFKETAGAQNLIDFYFSYSLFFAVLILKG
jgi:hypothetical protein